MLLCPHFWAFSSPGSQANEVGLFYIYTIPMSVLFASVSLTAYVLVVVRLHDVAYHFRYHTVDIGYDIDIGESSHVRFPCEYTG